MHNKLCPNLETWSNNNLLCLTILWVDQMVLLHSGGVSWSAEMAGRAVMASLMLLAVGARGQPGTQLGLLTGALVLL